MFKVLRAFLNVAYQWRWLIVVVHNIKQKKYIIISHPIIKTCQMVYLKEKETVASNNRINVIEACISFSIASISMILLNKGVATYFPGSMAFILMLQNLTTIGILKTVDSNGNLKFNNAIAWHWVPCALLFSLNIYSSLKAMVYINVATFTLLRNLQPLIVVALNIVSKTEPTPQLYSLYYLSCILFGAYVYAYHDIAFDWNGYFWCFVHITSMSLYAVFVKLKSLTHIHIDAHSGSNELNVMSAADMSWYNNILSIPILGFIYFIEIMMDSTANSLVNNLKKNFYTCMSSDRHLQCQSITILSMIGAYIISVVGFRAQKVLSPVGWVTLNNISKFPAIILSQLFWPSQLAGMEWVGLCFALASGYCYSLTKQDDIFQHKNQKNTTACFFALLMIYVITFMFPGNGWAIEYM